MIIDKSKVKIGFSDIIIFIISIIYLIGINTKFSTCEAMGDSFMNCHWAGEVLHALALLISVISLVHIFIPNGYMKSGIDIALVGIYCIMISVPGRIINICMMPDMQCRRYTLPFTTIIGIILIIAAIFDIIFYLYKENSSKHKRT